MICHCSDVGVVVCGGSALGGDVWGEKGTAFVSLIVPYWLPLLSINTVVIVTKTDPNNPGEIRALNCSCLGVVCIENNTVNVHIFYWPSPFKMFLYIIDS